MENPYKQLSKISPQREKGNRQIANDIFSALIMAKLSGSEYQLALSLIDKSWGFNKTSDGISYSQMREATKLTRPAVINSIKRLESKRVIVVDRKLVKGALPVNEYLFNKYYDTWLNGTGKAMFTNLEMEQMRINIKVVKRALPDEDQTSKESKRKLVNFQNKTSKHSFTHKRKDTKETITKENISTESVSQEVSEKKTKEIDSLIELYRETFPGHIKRWKLKTIVKMRELIEGAYLDGISLETIKERIKEAKSGTPWEILSEKWINNYKKEEGERERIYKHYNGAA